MNAKTDSNTVRTAALATLAASAVLLAAAHLLVRPAPVFAIDSNGNRDYQVVTAEGRQGGDLLYVLNNRTGQIAIMAFDPAQNVLIPMDVRNIVDLANGG